MKRLILAAVAILLSLNLMAQKTKTVDFEPATLVDQLTELLVKQTSDSDRQKANAKTMKAFSASYGALDEATQRRVADVYTYAQRAKLKNNPDLAALTATLVAYASAPGGGQNFEGWLQTLEAFKRKSAKAKAVNEWVAFSSELLASRTLYHSSSCQWNFSATTPFRLEASKEGTLVWFDTPADLHYASAKDEDVIHGTTGVYDYRDNTWRGQGGRLDWSRTGLGREACYADLQAYQAEVKFPKFNADSVLFTNTHYFSNPIRGRVEEVIGNPTEPEKYSYPRFRSYQRDFVLPDILPGVDYDGSFTMNGSKFVTASSKHPASLVFRREGKPQLRVTSTKFTLQPERLVAENATATLYLGDDDSITNNGLTVRFRPAEGIVHLINDAKRNFNSPFTDTYHGFDIYCEAIAWNIAKDEVSFANLGDAGSLSMVEFESANCYTYSKYRAIQGIDQENPVRRVYDYAGQVGSRFRIEGFSCAIGLDLGQTKLLIHNLSRHGLVTFNEMTQEVLVKEKLVDYVKAFAKAKGFDYDALTLESQTRGTNAVLSLQDTAIQMRGIRQFVVSDSHQVMVYPRGGLVSVGRNRDISFSGRVNCGKFVMYVTDADFSYEHYRFAMPHVDSLFFYVPEFDNPDTLHIVYTPLYGLVGTLTVDRDDNHSGLAKNKEYPIFESQENSFVYYDKPNIQRAQYVRERFFYTLHPFTLQSLADFRTDDLAFNGVLTSAGIFPDIKEPLRVQRDYYLGFLIETPAGGFPAYGGKGRYTSQVSLNSAGLRGAGELDYLTSHSASRDYLFLPDSALTVVDTFLVREEQGFPDVHNGRASMHWLPYADSMSVVTLKNGQPFRMYRDEALMRGQLALRPAGALASGTITAGDGTLTSQRFALASRAMTAEVSTFSLYSTAFKTTAFSASNVSSKVDYDARHGEFRNTEGPARSSLQMVQYEAFADQYDWEMDRQLLTLVNSTRPNSEGMTQMDLRMRLQKRDDMPGVRFVSTDPAQRSLAWNSLRANYMYNAGDLSAEGVYLLLVADAAIAPDADTLHVAKGGQMRVLDHAQLIANRDSAYHLITDASLIVASADDYTGKGTLVYVDDVAKKTPLFLDHISVHGGHTWAEGNIAADAQFQISSAFGFAGKVRAEGDKPLLHFDGGVRLIQPCIPADQLGLLAYSDYTDPEHVHVVVPELPTDWQGHRITASILLDPKTLQPQPAFLTAQRAADNELLAAHGVLTYLGGEKSYMIGSEQKVSDPGSVVAPYLALSTTDCTVEGEGPMDLTLRRTQASFYTYGTASVGIRNQADDYLRTVFGFTFPIDKGIVAALAQNLKDDLRLNAVPPTTNAEMRHALMHHLGTDKGAGAYALYSATGHLDKLPAEMVSTVLFDNLKWQYSPTMGLFYDGKAGIVSVGDEQLNLQVNVKAQIYMRGGSQQMVFYIQAATDHWYFFRFDLGSQELTLYSSSGTWLDLVKALPLEQRKIEREGLGTFRYFVGNNSSEVPAWLKWFAKTAYPGDDDY